MKVTYRGVNGLIEAEVLRVEYIVKTDDDKIMVVDERSIIEKKEENGT